MDYINIIYSNQSKSHTASQQLVIILVLLISLIPELYGQSLHRFNIEPLGNNLNLNSSDISALYQDQDGFIWVGTKAGISRFDGYEFKNYSLAGGTYLGQIHTIEADASGTIWIGGSNGLFYYKDNRFHNVQIPNHHIRALHLDNNQVLWVGGFGFIPFSLNDTELNVLKNRGKVQVRYITSPSIWQSKIQTTRIWAIDSDNEGNVWLGLENKMAYYDGTQIKIQRENTDGNHEYSAIAAINPDSVYWGSEDIGALLLKGGQITKLTDPLTYIFDKKDSCVYMLTTMELVSLKNGVFDTLHTFDAYSNLYFKEMILDREGIFWIGAEGNLLKMTPTQFQSWNVDHDSLLHSNHSIGQLPDGTIIIGSSKEKVLQVKDDAFIPYLNLDVPYNSYTSAIFPIHHGWTWYGTTMSGIFRQKGSIVENYNTEEGLGHKGQYLFYQDRKGRLWSGGENGISRINIDDQDRLSFNNYMVETSGEDFPTFRAMEEGPDGSLWAISDKGLFKLKHNSLVHFSFSESITPYPILTGIQHDTSGMLWLSTQGEGLWQCKFNAQFEPELIKQWSSADGLLSDVILDIHYDKLGRMWIASQAGICCLDLNASNSPSIQCYDKSDGWPEDPSAHYRILESNDGFLWVLGITSVARFPLYQLNQNSIPPRTFITDVEIFDGKENIYQYAGNPEDSLTLPKRLKLPYNKNFLSFHFTTTSHTASGKNTFRYKMKGLDPNWYEGTSNRSVNYPGIQPGSYSFQVQAINNDGIYDNEIASFSFIILPPWYLTWWAWTLGLGAVISLTYVGIRYHLNRKNEKQEAIRLKELDAFKSRFYTNITHEFRTPLTVIKGMTGSIQSDLKDHKHNNLGYSLEIIDRNSDGLLNLINEMLDLAKIESGNMELNLIQVDIIPYLKYLTHSFESLAQGKGIDFNIQFKIDQLNMDLDVNKFTAIVNNLLSNAIKFTPDGGMVNVRIDVSQENSDEHLKLVVEDNGIGISKEEQAHIFDKFYQADNTSSRLHKGTGIGLSLVKEFIELMNGSIVVESKKNIGTSFTMIIPITKEATMTSYEKIISAMPVMDSSLDVKAVKSYPTEVLVDENLPLVLIIEDNPDVAYYINTCLQGNYQTLHAENGVNGIERALGNIPDVVITDVMMPEKDGFEVCEFLKTNELTDHIPIIMLTAKATFEDRLTGLSYGADAYLTKPFAKAELITRIEQLILLRKKMLSKFEKTGIDRLLHKKEKTSESRFLNKVISIISENLVNPDFSPKELAHQLHISESQLYRKLKATSDKSTAIFIRSTRVQIGKDLLVTTDKSISEVAYEVGFNDPAYFSRAFKKEFGHAPSELVR